MLSEAAVATDDGCEGRNALSRCRLADDDDDVWLQSVYMTDAVVCTYMETIVAVYVTISLLIKFYSIIIDTILFFHVGDDES